MTPTVLVIDDDEMVRRLLVQALTGANYRVIEAGDGQSGLALARENAPDLVVTDLVMPVQEGVETIMALRRDRPRLPIIAISGGVTNSKLYLDIAAKIGARRRTSPAPSTTRSSSM